jgi:RNA polymerase sigma-70 factor (ECF subfamily)
MIFQAFVTKYPTEILIDIHRFKVSTNLLMHKDQSEAKLVELAVDGDVEAFGSLYEKFIDSIFRYVFFRVGDYAESQDITETVFIKAWEALPLYQHNGTPFSSWLYRIAHNAVIDFHRKRSKNDILLDPQIDWVEFEEPHPGPLAQIIAEEERTILVKAISTLPDEHQQILILRFVEGLTHKEIAQLLGKNDGACRMIQHRALEALAKILKNY